MEAEGYLDSHYMSKTFSYLRAKDLVYGPAVRSYMLGEPPPAFDLLFWNGDSTNLPGKMTVQYLRGLCLSATTNIALWSPNNCVMRALCRATFCWNRKLGIPLPRLPPPLPMSKRLMVKMR